jgi:hypothetical protein
MLLLSATAAHADAARTWACCSARKLCAEQQPELLLLLLDSTAP